MSRRVVLIDGDILSYRVGFACEHKLYYATIDGEDFVFEGKAELNKYVKEHEPEEVEWESQLKVEPISFALATAKGMLHNIQAATKADEVELYLTGADNFREKVATVLKYKGNRDDARRPMLHAQIVDYLIKFHGGVLVNGAEADDELADMQQELEAEGHEPIIASDDKDLLQIPGKHYNIRSDTKVLVSEETARKNKYIQMLVGDSTDNIPGIYGMGPAKATKILQDVAPEAYRIAVETHWHDYLTNGKKLPEWLEQYYPDTTTVEYLPWNADMQTKIELSDLVDEIEQLITVGVRYGRHGTAV